VQLEAQAHTLSEQIEVEARKTQQKLDELKLRREEIKRLQTQYEELVAQRQFSQGEVRRLRDLVFQAQGVLERVERRRQQLKADGGDVGYDEPETASGGR
jgi:chromosome segregation ATPase